jgi:hypothetical protein
MGKREISRSESGIGPGLFQSGLRFPYNSRGAISGLSDNRLYQNPRDFRPEF